MKRSLTKIGGVSKVDVSLEKAEAVVTFDDGKATIETLTKATTSAGFQSTPKR